MVYICFAEFKLGSSTFDDNLLRPCTNVVRDRYIHDHLHVRMLFSGWIPCNLKDQKQVELCEEIIWIGRFEMNDYLFLRGNLFTESYRWSQKNDINRAGVHIARQTVEFSTNRNIELMSHCIRSVSSFPSLEESTFWKYLVQSWTSVLEIGSSDAKVYRS